MNMPTEHLVRLLYASRMSAKSGPKELAAILHSSRRNNAAMGVTGILCYSATGFLQCMEGPRDAVNELYRRIVRDPRNEAVTLLSFEDIRRRRFGKWLMAYLRADEVDGALLARHGADDGFDPFSMTAAQALALLSDTARERDAFLARQQREAAH